MIIKRKSSKQPQNSGEDINTVSQYVGNSEIELPQVAEQDFEMQDFAAGIDEEPVQTEVVQGIEPPTTMEPVPQASEEIDLFNLDNIDFRQRQERRRGDRRRGFRRVDDRNLISRAREEADSIREAAQKEGYEEGLRQAAFDLEQIKDSLKTFLSAPQEVFDYIAPDIMEISVDIAQKIIKKEVSQNPEVVLESIVNILKTLPKDEPKVTIRVNPQQVSITKQAIPEILDLAGLEARVTVLRDESVTEGGCMVTTNNGVIDATIESQISIVKEALREI